jgi:hypothetical protein
MLVAVLLQAKNDVLEQHVQQLQQLLQGHQQLQAVLQRHTLTPQEAFPAALAEQVLEKAKAADV